jgi:tetratricopeptide (TPR) repeat protein
MYEECISKIDLALTEGQSDPVSAKLFNLKGLCLSHQNEHNRAVECYVAAIKLDPLYPVPYSNIADSHAKNLQFGEAKKYFELALTIDEIWQRPWLGWAWWRFSPRTTKPPSNNLRML